MSSIRVINLGKAYKQYSSNLDRLLDWMLPNSPPRHKLKWALSNISFEVSPGESVGIVGANGAGKSTLLKIVTGTTRATTGTVEINGRVAALLELGTGFHPEFTGRQNVLMAGQLMGIDLDEIIALMPEIEAFAEIGGYLDQPLRTYSSGMQMRLAFSVATAKRPEILIVDEALSVGDAYFQHKSLDRIRQFRKEGTTLLIVSHDRYAIQSVCDRAILLSDGQLEWQGLAEEVMDYYHAMLAQRENQIIKHVRHADGRFETVSGTGEATVIDIALIDAEGHRTEVIEVGTEVTLAVKIAVKAPIQRLVMGYMIKDRLGQSVYGINTHRMDIPVIDAMPGEEITYRFAFPMNIGKGHYSISTSLSRYDSHLDMNYEWRDYGLIFHIINTKYADFVGCAWLEPKFSFERQAPALPSPE
ncbi:MAG TPA: ABC transporter ATP-binding protein [Rhodocyclaceae bacterium]|nr:ABC transporter ATP-binding protein [Rhodocyclaceae bacterium]